MALIEHYRLKSIVYLVIIFWLLLCSFLISMKLGPSQYVQSSTEIWSAVATCVSQVASHVDKNLIGWDFVLMPVIGQLSSIQRSKNCA